MKGYHHRLIDCDLEYLMAQARRLNWPYPLPSERQQESGQ